MYNTAELIETKFKSLIEQNGLDEAVNDIAKKGLIAEVRMDSPTIKVLKIKNVDIQDFGSTLLKKFPDGDEDTTRRIEKKIWRKFRDSIVEVESENEEEMKSLFRGVGAAFVWYPDMKEWHFFGSRGSTKRLCEVV